MNGYIIKATYLTGPNTGRSYFLQKALERSNMLEHVLEKRYREYQSKNGYNVSKYMINELMKYTPYFVKTVHNSDVH
jgi:hypothetical protein